MPPQLRNPGEIVATMPGQFALGERFARQKTAISLCIGAAES
jgi:hypothetical protein